MFVKLKELRPRSDRTEDDDGEGDEGLQWSSAPQGGHAPTPEQREELLRSLAHGVVLQLRPRSWAELMEAVVEQSRVSEPERVLELLLQRHREEAELSGSRTNRLSSDLDPGRSEAALVLSGAHSSLSDPLVALVRLQEPVLFRSVLKVPVRILVLSLSPTFDEEQERMGRGLCALLQDQDQSLSDALSRAQDRDDLLRALGQCLDPPRSNGKEPDVSPPLTPPSAPPSDPLRRSGALFGGLLKDLRHRYPQYGSDLSDALNAQCVAAVIFIYFAALSPAVTFGGLMGEKTDGLIGVSELIIATSLQGLVFAALGAQPVLIVGFSGPLLVFEEAFYNFCLALDVEYLTARLWVGLWLVLVVVVTVAMEGSVLVRHVSRFTQEIFSVLISLIFIYETFVKLVKIFLQHPLKRCSHDNATDTPDWSNGSASDWLNGSLSATAQGAGPGQPNTALLSFVLMFGTYLSALCLRKLKNSALFPGPLRRLVGDFGVPISIFITVMIDYSLKDTYTQKLSVPSGLSVSSPEKRAWLVPPLGAEGRFPVWMALASAGPALLAFILLFMESQITALIVSRRVVKGTGFHADLLIIVLVGGVSALFGLPWLSAATVRSVTHANALTVETRPQEETRPQTRPEKEKPRPQEEKPHPLEEKPCPQEEKPHPLEEKPCPQEEKPRPRVIEQRVTGFVVALLVGLSVLVGGLLRQIPVAVLFGVFLYMGVMSLQGVQLTERITLLFKPSKHHPKSGYTCQLRPWRMHLYTCVQLTCLAALWVVMATPLALAFPIGVLLTVPLRKLLLPLLFTPGELQLLDSDGQEGAPQQDEYEQLQMPV